MKNKKILELCLSPDLGGLELFVKDSFEYFGTKTDTYLCVAPEKKLDAYVDSKDKFLLKRDKFLPFIPALKLAKYIDANDIDIIHFHWTRDIIVSVLAKTFSSKKPKIIQSRHMGMTRFKDDFYHRWIYKNVDAIHAVTKKVEEQLHKFIPSDISPKIFMNYLGVKEPKIDVEKVKSLKEKYKIENQFIVGVVGRIENIKGQHIVLDAIVKLKDLDIKLFVVGSAMNDDYLEDLKEKVRINQMEEKVIFTGFTKDVNSYMQLCDALVLATENETFGLVVIESMINKKVTLAVNKGGPLEIIENQVDGILFERDSDKLALELKTLYEDKDYKEKISLNGYTKVKDKFCFEKQGDLLFERLNNL